MYRRTPAKEETADEPGKRRKPGRKRDMAHGELNFEMRVPTDPPPLQVSHGTVSCGEPLRTQHTQEILQELYPRMSSVPEAQANALFDRPRDEELSPKEAAWGKAEQQ